MNFYDIRCANLIISDCVLKLFQTYSPFSVIALLIATLILKLFWLSHPEGAIMLEHQKALGLGLPAIQWLTGNSYFALTFLAVINLAAQALVFNRIVMEADLFPTRNYLPALCLILFSSLLPEWNYLSAPLIANWFLLIALNGIFKLHNTTTPGKLIFNIGFSVACAGILSFPYLGIILLVYVTLNIFRPFKMSEWAIGFLGFLTPFYFLVALLFLSDQLNSITTWWPEHVQFTKEISDWSLKDYIPLAFSLLLIIIGLFYLNRRAEHMLTIIKKRWTAVISGFVLGVLLLFFEATGGIALAFPALFFLSIIAANAFLQRNKKWPGRILFYLFLAVLIFAEWINIP